jgi:hypothetical protein
MSDASQPRRPPRKRGRPLRPRSARHVGAPETVPPAGGGHDETGLVEQHSRAYAWLLVGIRYVLPVVVTLCGLVFMALGGETDLEGGASLVSAGLAIYFLNWLYRIGVQGDRERDTEEAARDYFARHGRWPN